jgi:hypothetical protein
MTATIVPIKRNKRCDTFALALVRAAVVADLRAELSTKPAKQAAPTESKFMTALLFITRLYIATGWLLTVLLLSVLTLALPAYCVGYVFGLLTK